jgi:hypothetical protein
MRNKGKFCLAATVGTLMVAAFSYAHAAPAFEAAAAVDVAQASDPYNQSQVFGEPRQLTLPPGLMAQAAPPPRRQLPSTFPETEERRIADAGAASVLPNTASCPASDLRRLAPPPVPGLGANDPVLSGPASVADGGTPCPAYVPHTAPFAGAELGAATGPVAPILPGTRPALAQP